MSFRTDGRVVLGVSRHMTSPRAMLSSEQLAKRVRATSYQGARVTLIGCGAVGRQYLAALQALGVPAIRVCSRAKKLEVTHPGGYQQFREKSQPGEVAIIATPIADLLPAAVHFRELGFTRFLIEKPMALRSDVLDAFARECVDDAIEVTCAYNRVAYPSVIEARARVAQEGGITSCAYSFTELLDRIDLKAHAAETLQRWGIANSLHVMSMAHGLIGLPKEWSTYRTGGKILPWHPDGARFVGAGVSQLGIPFSYHADWGSAGRWSVEVHTAVSSYRLCPLERLFHKTASLEEWKEISVSSVCPDIKPGFLEQLAAVLNPEIRTLVPLVDLQTTQSLMRFGEDIFGYH